MYLLRAVYTLALASTNIAMGWLFYYLSEPVFGGVLVVIGVFVILTSVGSTLSRCQSVLSNQH